MKGKKRGPVKNYSGTALTTDEQEVQFRKQRGLKESMECYPSGEYPYPFDNYFIRSESGLEYTVEIRSLSEKINTCSCPDFHINELGTCKHIEKVLISLNSSQKRKEYPKTSSLIELFQESGSNEIIVQWPDEVKNHSLKEVLSSYFSEDNRLVSDPFSSISSIQNLLCELPNDLKIKVRVSPYLISMIGEQKKSQGGMTKEQFVDEVKAGKRSIQMVNAQLYPYQEEGMLHLAFQKRALLADEMGLGKTIQAIAACELLRRLYGIQRVVVISPASLKGEWEEQIAKFTGLSSLIVYGARHDRLASYLKPSFFYLLNYEQVRSDFLEIQNLINPDVIILDEAQRIKNWQTITAWSVKQLKSPYAFVLTGTPIENRIDELYSIMQMVDPRILGPLHQFHRNYFKFNEKNKPVEYTNLNQLHDKLKPVLMRRLKKDVEEQLPERTLNTFFVEMEKEQATRYNEYNDKVARLLHMMKKRPLTEDEQKKLQQYLACMRMIADTPYILDDECKICPKLVELKQVLAELLESSDNKIIIFSEWERMLDLIREFIEDELKINFAWHTGTVPQLQRRADIKRFKEDPQCRFFLTTDSGSTGLNLQVANVVINMDLPWNPAKFEQRIARAWRKNQTRTVQVINFVTANSIEQRMLSTLARKKNLADGILDGIGNLSSMSLTSARTEILEQLEEMFDDEKSTTEILELNEKKDLKQIASQAVQQFNDRIRLIEKYEDHESGEKTILTVVDTLDRNIVPKMKEMISSVEPEDNNPVHVEFLDSNTFELLQRLAKAGIITINENSAQTIHRSLVNQKIHQTEKEKRLTEARKHISDCERKQKMSNLLASGGFLIEALPPAAEALSFGLKSYFALKKEHHFEGEQLYKKLQKLDEEITEQEASALLSTTNNVTECFSQEITKFSLT